MKKLMEMVKNFHEDEQGDIVQTGIIIGIFAVLAVGALIFLQPKIKALFDTAGEELDDANNVSY